MMFNNPYFSFPYYNRYSRYGYRPVYYNNSTHSNTHNIENSKNINNSNYRDDVNTTKKINDNRDCLNTDICDNEDDVPMFEIFGIKLFFDDILLICLIFFLYKEEVKDQSLFISLILLLLS